MGYHALTQESCKMRHSYILRSPLGGYHLLKLR
nr:MAG TPA: hypothetical protein [Caudoviricetes sp.]